MNNEPTLTEQVQRALRNLTIATVVLYLVLVAFGTFAWIEAANRRDDIKQAALSANSALCALRNDVERRVVNSQEFLDKHPGGIPGISRQDIKQSIANQRRTIKALGDLECSGKP